jgi:hypothetical protein
MEWHDRYIIPKKELLELHDLVANDRIADDLPRLAATLNYRTLRLHERLLANRHVGAVGLGMKQSEATYLFGVSLPSVKHFA